MEIIKQGHYPEKNRKICDKCECEFRYFDNEIKYDATNEDEETLCGGFGYCRYVICPTCREMVIIEEGFVEREKTWLDNILKRISKLGGSRIWKK